MSQWVCWLGASLVTWGEVGHRRSGSVQCVCSGKGRRGWRGPGVGQGPRRPGPRARGAGATGRRRGGGRVSLGPAGGRAWRLPLRVSAAPHSPTLQTGARALRSGEAIFPSKDRSFATEGPFMLFRLPFVFSSCEVLLCDSF